MSDDELAEALKALRKGIVAKTPVFDGATEDELWGWLKLAGLPDDGKVTLYDGRTGEAFHRPVTVGCMIRDGQEVQAGDILARKPRESSKTKDIVGGLPRVAELFEVRKPKEMAVVSEIDGVVSFGAETKGKRKIVVTPEAGDAKEYLIPRGKHVTVQEGDFVEAGELLTEGYPELHDILKIKGEKFLAKYLVDEIQDVYRFQGVAINDKHIEIIVRQMLKKVSVLDSGETNFLIGEQVDKIKFMDREGIRRLAAEELGLATSPYRFADTKAEFLEACRTIGFPCVVKPVMGPMWTW